MNEYLSMLKLSTPRLYPSVPLVPESFTDYETISQSKLLPDEALLIPNFVRFMKQDISQPELLQSNGARSRKAFHSLMVTITRLPKQSGNIPTPERTPLSKLIDV
jgi:hypothetical protein